MGYDDVRGAQPRVWLPADQPATPTPGPAAPAGYGVAPAGHSAAPAGYGAAPAGYGSAPAGYGAAPAGYDAAPDPYAWSGSAPEVPFVPPSPAPAPAPNGAQTPYGGPNPYGGPTPYGTTAPYGGPTPYGAQGYYPAQPYYGQPLQTGSPTLAIVGFVLAVVLAPVGAIVSIVALVRARHGSGGGRGLAIGGVAVGVALTLLTAVAIPVVLNQRHDEEEVRSAFVRLEDALVQGDCAAYMASTTEGFRQSLNAATCEDFAAFTAPLGTGPQFGNVPITDLEVHGDTATVSTLESLGPDANGSPQIFAFDYTLVEQAGTWLVDEVALGD